MVMHYYINYDFGKTKNINSKFHLLIVDHLCEPINDKLLEVIIVNKDKDFVFITF